MEQVPVGRCAQCKRWLIDCPGQSTVRDGKTVCEPCAVTLDRAAAND